MVKLPQKPAKPYGQLETFERQDLFNTFCDQEIFAPFEQNQEGAAFPSIKKRDEMYDNFLFRVYNQPDVK